MSFKGQRRLFARLEQLAKIANMNKSEREQYEQCLKVYRDNHNVLEYAIQEGEERGFKKGKEEGMKEGMHESALKIARQMKSIGIPISQIMACTGLKEEEI